MVWQKKNKKNHLLITQIARERFVFIVWHLFSYSAIYFNIIFPHDLLDNFKTNFGNKTHVAVIHLKLLKIIPF